MKLVIFGLTVSSSWGNGHATLWRGLIRALGARGHEVVFFERDVPYYAAHRDLVEVTGGHLIIYPDWATVLPLAKRHLADADMGMVTSYCPDGIDAADLVLASRAPVRAFYDLDTPVTLERLQAGAPVDYIGPRGLSDFDLVLSFTGGAAPGELARRLGAKRVVPLYGSVDPEVHRPVPVNPDYRADLSYLGTYSADRQEMVEALHLEPARRLPERRFMIGGSQYPADFAWTENIHYKSHVPPPDHPAFYCSAPLALNLTRRPMARMGYCPSGRLFEAAACGVPVLSDAWEGVECFFEPGTEILIAHGAEDVVAALKRSREELARIGAAARERALTEHTAARRAVELETAVEGVLAR
jgi:spore maturation protein CgeB